MTHATTHNEQFEVNAQVKKPLKYVPVVND